MRQRMHFITVGVPDVDEARRFYVEGLGWTPTFEVPGEVVFLQVAPGVLLSLWGAADLAADIGEPATAPAGDGRAPAPVALAHNVGSAAEVGQVLESAAAAGATILKAAQRADFGGYHGYFADPGGLRWEVAYNPGWSVDDGGRVHLGPIPGPEGETATEH